MDAPERSGPSRPSRRGLGEYVVLVALLALAAASAVAFFGEELRALFGLPGPAPTAERPRG